MILDEELLALAFQRGGERVTQLFLVRENLLLAGFHETCKKRLNEGVGGRERFLIPQPRAEKQDRSFAESLPGKLLADPGRVGSRVLFDEPEERARKLLSDLQKTARMQGIPVLERRFTQARAECIPKSLQSGLGHFSRMTPCMVTESCFIVSSSTAVFMPIHSSRGRKPGSLTLHGRISCWRVSRGRNLMGWPSPL